MSNTFTAHAGIKFFGGAKKTVSKEFPNDLTIADADKAFKDWAMELLAEFTYFPDEMVSTTITVPNLVGSWEY